MQLFPNYADAIAGIETAGQKDPYATVGPKTVRKDGSADYPYGRYQIMGSNIPDWTEQILGQRMTPQELMSHPDSASLQDYIFNTRFGNAVQKYGNPQDAASEWFTGRPLAQGGNSSDVLGTTGNAYVDKFNANLAKQQGNAGPQSPMVAAFAPQQGAPAPAADAPAQPSPAAAPNASVDRLFKGNSFDPDNALMGLGAGLVSLSNPQAGGVLAAQAKDQRAMNMTRDAQQATFRSLVSRGVPAAEASAAALSPDIMKAVAAKYFDAKPWKVVQTGQNIFGQNEYASHNEATNEFRPIGAGPVAPGAAPGTVPGTAVTPGGGVMPAGVNMPPAANSASNFDINKFQAAKDAGATPDQLREMLPPVIRSEVDATLEGRASTNPLARQGPMKSAIMLAAHAIDPSFDEKTADARKKVADELASSGINTLGGQKKSMNTLIDHMDDYAKSVGGLKNNTGSSIVNGIFNPLFNQVDPETRKALADVDAKREVIATELPRFLRGAGAAESDVQGIRDALDHNKSPDALLTTIRSYIQAMRSRAEPMVDNYNKAFGKNESPDFFLGDKQKEIVKRLEATGGPAPAGTPTAGFKVIKVH